jgi:hypothetical protein
MHPLITKRPNNEGRRWAVRAASLIALSFTASLGRTVGRASSRAAFGDSRDRNDLANAAFARPVPAELMSHLQSHREILLPEFRRNWEAAGFKNAGSIAGFSLTHSNRTQQIQLGNYTLTATLRTNRRNPADLPERGYGLVMPLGPQIPRFNG